MALREGPVTRIQTTRSVESDPHKIRSDDWRFGARYLLRNTILSLLAAAVFYFGLASEGSTRWIAAAVFLAMMAGWIAADLLLFRRYKCPRCNTALHQPTQLRRSPGDPIVYHCSKCSIEWDTRLRESGEF